MGMKGPRRMIIIIPGMNKDGERVPIRPRSVSKTQTFAQITDLCRTQTGNIFYPVRIMTASSPDIRTETWRI